MKMILIEAGHGKPDIGASYHGTTEREQVVAISRLVLDKLRGTGIEIVEIGVSQEISLLDKIKRINQICNNAGLSERDSLLVSIHTNAGGGTGIEGWYYGGSDTSKKLSDSIVNRMVASTGLRNRGSKPDTSNQHGRLGIIRDTTPLACLIECGFLDSLIDLTFIRNHELIAESIAQGIKDFIGFKPVEKPVEAVQKMTDKQFREEVEALVKRFNE